MADRYLVGNGNRMIGAGVTNYWSSSSGGPGGASEPTKNDSIIIDGNSGTGTITIFGSLECNDFDTYGLTGNITLVNSAYSFSVYGHLITDTNLTISFTGTGYLYLKATVSGRMITSNGNTGSWNRIYFYGVGGGWTLQDNWNIGSSQIRHTNGTLNSNNFNITSTNQYIVESGTKTLTLGSSTFDILSWNNQNPTNFTFNSNTSTVILRQTTGTIVYGANTFYNLTLIGGANISSSFSFANNITVSNTLTITGSNSTNYRLLIASNTIGTARTITCNGTVTASKVDFRDISAAGSANWNLSSITGGSGDCGGNSGITFTPAQKQYFKHTSGAVNWSDATKWFSDLSPRTTTGRVPLPQDDVQFDASSFTGTSTLTVNCPRIGRSLDMSAVNQAVTMAWANNIECYGSYVLGNNITPSGNYIGYLMGRGNYNLNLYEKLVNSIYINAFGGTYTNQSNLIFVTWISARRGILDFNGYNCTGLRPFDFDDAFPTVFLRNGTFTGTGNPGNFSLYLGNGTLNPGTSEIIFKLMGTDNSEIRVNGKTLNKVRFSGSHTGNFDITGSNTFAELIIDAGRKVRFTAGTTQQIGKATIGAGATIGSITNATHTLNYTGIDIVETDEITVSYSNATPANKWYAGANSTNGGNNSGWIFESLKRITASLTQEELLQTSPFSDVLFSSEFNELEYALSELLINSHISIDIEEHEEINSENSIEVFIYPSLNEHEEGQFIPASTISIQLNLSETEQKTVSLIDIIHIISNFDEVESIDAVVIYVDEGGDVFDYEIISGQSQPTKIISGISNYSKIIIGRSEFSKLISGQSNYK